MQVNPQVPETQLGVAEAGAGQACPHFPQFVVLVFTSTHRSPQADRLAPHDATHAPPEQTSGLVQAVAQVPQCAASDDRSTQAPPQLVKPGAQAEPQVPPVRLATALTDLKDPYAD